MADAARNAWYRNASMYHQRFEGAFARYIGVHGAIALPSCNSAIHLSLLALGVGPGDEVIVQERLGGLGGLILNHEPPDTRNSYWMVTLILAATSGIVKDRLLESLDACHIDCRAFFNPVSSLPAYRESRQAQQARERNHVSYRLSPYGINLPSALTLTEDAVSYVCESLKSGLRVS